MRDAFFALTFGGSLIVFPAAHATAGTITVTYALTGGGIDLSILPLSHVSPTSGKATVALKAYRSTTGMGLLASFGYIKGGYILSLSLKGYTASKKYPQTWTVGLGKVGKGIPLPLLLVGSFFGATPAGSALKTGGGFSVTAPVYAYGSVYVTHGLYGPFYISGSGKAKGYGTAFGGMGEGCWNGKGPPGACAAFTPFVPPVSVSVPVAGPGFNVGGFEIARTVAVPEPSKNLMLVLGLGLVSLLSLVNAASGRRSRP